MTDEFPGRSGGGTREDQREDVRVLELGTNNSVAKSIGFYRKENLPWLDGFPIRLARSHSFLPPLMGGFRATEPQFSPETNVFTSPVANYDIVPVVSLEHYEPCAPIHYRAYLARILNLAQRVLLQMFWGLP